VTQPFENLILNPSAFASDRTEVDLSALGIRMGEAGPDYGESSVTVERVRQAIGEGVTDRRWPPVECTIPLVLGTDLTLPLADAVHRIEATAATIQQRGGGWIERVFADAGGFAGSVACPIDAMGLSGLQGLMMGRGEFAPEVILKLSRYPIWFATVEVEGAEVKASAVRDLQWEIAEMLGTAPGLIRIRIKNENATADLRGLISAIESRDYAPDPTAALAYAAEELTLAGGSEKSFGIVQNLTLTAGWVTVLSSQITGVGHMTHVGVRRMWFGIEDPSSATGNLQLRLDWRPLGSLTWSENKIVTAPLVGHWALIDLGECRPQLAALGDQRWEWRLNAKSLSGTGAINIRRVYPLPVEQMAVLKSPAVEAQVANTQVTNSPGTVADAAGIGTVAWENAGNAKVSDGVFATASGGGITHFLKATNFGFAIPSTATIFAILVGVERSQSGKGDVDDEAVRLVKGGVIGTTDRARPGYGWPEVEEYAFYGGDLWGDTWTPANINATTFGAAIAADTLNVESLSARVDHIQIGVYYSEAKDENRVCFAGRLVELRSDGMYRQHPTDEVWGSLIPEAGSIFQAPPGGLENRTARGIVIPTQGDLGVLADEGSNKLSVTPIYRPGYLFAREAA
jgi:hypothetical protein